MNEFVAFGGNSVVAFYHVHRRIFVVSVINSISPFRGFSSNQFTERQALHVFRNVDAGIIKESRSKVKIQNQFVDFSTGLYFFWITHQQRCAE